ncbi:MAG TPA: chemotaxis protein CheA [bacterium]|nr:chemotaxis protein CheA [bacterium]
MLNKDGLYHIFVEESRELLTGLEADLLELEKDLQNTELINRVFRSVHTLKGSSGMVEFAVLTDFTHELENILARLRAEELRASQKLISLLLESVDILKRLIEQRPDRIPESFRHEMLRNTESLKRYQGIDIPSENTPKRPVETKDGFNEKYINIVLKFRPDIYSSGTDPLLLLKELSEQGEIVRVRCDMEGIPAIDRIQHDKFYLSWELVLRTAKPLSAIENIFIFVRDDNTISLEDISSRFKEGVDLLYADKKLGEILEEEGLIDQHDLDNAIKEQKRSGEILIEQKKVDSGVLDEVLRRQQRSKELTQTSTLRVDTGKLDKLVNLVGEMVIGVARMAQLIQSSTLSHNRDLNDTLDQLERISRDVQEQVMRVRMIPIEATFRRFQRVVRDIANDLGKKINLYLSGTETELDKTVIERIDDPLKHLIRNSVDHGIEQPEERLKRGKPVEGSVWLRAYQQEGKIIVEVEDDGYGIDKERILRKAVELGIVPKGAEVPEQELYGFLFLPGFSTAKKVTELSGRGVGLDVVKRNIESLRGSIEVYSEKGNGTLFRIKLPLTLAIIDGMRVAVGSEILTIPLLSIIEAVRPGLDSIKTIEGKGELMEFRGEYLPLIRLYELLGFETAVTDPEEAIVIIIEASTRRMALMVDDVIGQHQAVIKSLDTNYRRIEGTSGATILGDGRVSIILDVHGIESLAFGKRRAKEGVV